MICLSLSFCYFLSLRAHSPPFFSISLSLSLSLQVQHHHLCLFAKHSSVTLIWANFFFLFMLTLLPASISWTSRYPNASAPGLLYMFICILIACSRTIFQRIVKAQHQEGSVYLDAINTSWKGIVTSMLVFLAVMLCTFVSVWAGKIVVLALIGLWAAPDARIEAALEAIREEENMTSASGPGLASGAALQSSTRVRAVTTHASVVPFDTHGSSQQYHRLTEPVAMREQDVDTRV
jgi:uncharacterized membrane protein